MAAKAILVLCAQALIAQSVFAQCLNRGPMNAGPFNKAAPFNQISKPFGPMPSTSLSSLANRNWPSKSLSDLWPSKSVPCATPAMEITPTSGGGMPVTSSSAIPPTGLTVVSENAYEGALAVAGEVPFVGSTGVDGLLPTAGAGATNYGCGDGVTAMVSETGPAITSAAITPNSAMSGAAISSAAGVTPAARFGSCGRGLTY